MDVVITERSTKTETEGVAKVNGLVVFVTAQPRSASVNANTARRERTVFAELTGNPPPRRRPRSRPRSQPAPPAEE